MATGWTPLQDLGERWRITLISPQPPASEGNRPVRLHQLLEIQFVFCQNSFKNYAVKSVLQKCKKYKKEKRRTQHATPVHFW